MVGEEQGRDAPAGGSDGGRTREQAHNNEVDGDEREKTERAGAQAGCGSSP